MCYKCNNFGHIVRNCHAPDDQQHPRSRTPVCQLCNNFGHIVKYCKMDKNFGDRRNNGRNFKNKRNNGRNARNARNDRRNHEKNFETKKDNEMQRNVISEF